MEDIMTLNLIRWGANKKLKETLAHTK